MHPDIPPSAAASPRRHFLARPLVLGAAAGTAVVAATAALVFTLWPQGVTIVVVPAGVPVVAAGTRVRATAECDSCGAVESIRRIDPATGLPIYEFTVRMRDGSARESSESKPGRWREGEGVLLIGGSKARAAEERENAAPEADAPAP